MLTLLTHYSVGITILLSLKLVVLGFIIIKYIKRNKTINQLKYQELIYRTIFENTGNPLVMLNNHKIIDKANKEFISLTGYKSAEICGQLKWSDLIKPASDDQIKESSWQGNTHLILKTKNGENIACRAIISPVNINQAKGTVISLCNLSSEK